MLKLGSICAVAVLLLIGTATAQTFSIQLEGGAFRVAGWKPPASAPAKGWPSVFAVYAGAGDVPPLLGTYAVEGGSLVFHPRFPLGAGVKYRAVFQPPGSSPVRANFAGPKKDSTPSTRVERVYPSTDLLPSNQLKLYVYFSAPMSRGEAWDHLHLLDEAGKVVPYVFLELTQELWDRNNQRLTVLFDPGRIKRGVASNLQLGAPIAEGKRYTLLIGREWKDARGVPLVAGFRKAFRGGPEDRTSPDPKKWTLTVPKAATVLPLVIDFPDPMDHVLMQRMLDVTGPQGRVAGTVVAGRQETQWRFTPSAPWQACNYQLVIDTELEDLAGNKVSHLFDIDVFDQVTRTIETKTVSVPFSVR